MAKAFDPYRMWLGIPIAEQPPTHYRLLGVSPDERQADVIEAAVVRQSAYVRNFQTGQNADDAARILNEIAAAGVCLTDPERRAAYDAELKATARAPTTRAARPSGKRAPSAPRRPPAAAARNTAGPSPVWADIPPPAAPLAPGRASLARGRDPLARGKRISSSWEPKPSSPSWQAPLVIAGIVLLLVLVVIFVRFGRNSDLAALPEAPAIEPDENRGDPDANPAGSPVPAAPQLVPPAVKTPDSTRANHSIVPVPAAPNAAPNNGGEREIETKENRKEPAPQASGASQRPPPEAVPVPIPGASDDETSEKIAPQRNAPAKAVPAPAPPQRLAFEKRLQRPAGEALAAARRQVKSKNFKKNASVSQALDPLRAIYDTSRSAADNPALRYALLEEARERAKNLGDAATACQVVEDLFRVFDGDLLESKAAALKVMDKARAPRQVYTAAMLALLLTDRAARADQFDLAEQFANVAKAAARKIGNSELLNAADERLTKLRSRRQEYKKFRDALKKLKASPDDRDANLVAGRYYCWFQGDWGRGLPLLARSSDRQLGELAALELEAQADRSRASGLADAWLAAADLQRRAEETRYLEQAKFWRHRALHGGAAGVGAAGPGSANRQADAARVSVERLELGLVREVFEGAGFKQLQKKSADWQVDFEIGDSALPAGKFSVRWTGWLVPPFAGKFSLAIASDETVRLRLDDKSIIDLKRQPLAVNGQGTQPQRHAVELTAGPHELVVEMEGALVDSSITLLWSFKDSTEHVVPAEAFYFDSGW
ncbi:MAG TPA: PA14 domain-containing protein [Pirellulales bacterium]|nr:PA14 domain-containing protein [Pirellulales bacterium]